MSSSQSPSGQNLYAPLPFSYLTGGNNPERGPTGLPKRSVSQDDLDHVGLDQNQPYSIYSGRAPDEPRQQRLQRKDSIDVVDPRLDVMDPYLLSTGALSRQKGASLGDLRDSYSEDPRYRDSVPSQEESGNVFFRSPDEIESAAKASRAPETKAHPQESTNSLNRPGYTNPNLDTMTRDEEGQGKKLPRFKVAENGGVQYYTGSNDTNAKPLNQPTQSAQPKPKHEENPIWDKYYATGGLAPGYEGYQPTTTPSPAAASPGVRPTTKEDDFNTLLRNSSSDGYGSRRGCCKSKKSAVVTAVLLTALICLGAGFAAGWFIYQVVNSDTTTAIPPVVTTMPSSVSETLAATTTTTTPTPVPVETTSSESMSSMGT